MSLRRFTLLPLRLPLARPPQSAQPQRSLSSAPLRRPRPPVPVPRCISAATATRGIKLQAQPPENPSEDWEPLEEGEDASIDLTEAAIKVGFSGSLGGSGQVGGF